MKTSPNWFLKGLVLVLATTALQAFTPRADWPILSRKGDKIMEGEKEFRFSGLNAPNLQANESQIKPDFSNRFPDEFETRDILGAIQRMGGQATRMFSLSVYSSQDAKGMPFYIMGTRTYNEEAFKALDLILALCHEYDVRVIFPFIDSHSFGTVRGIDEFSGFRGKLGSEFWTDEQLKDDFRHLLSYILNRRNTVSGLLYKDDPAILCWQLGNELDSYGPDRKLDREISQKRLTAWSVEMAAYIRSLDSKHLIMEAGGDREVYKNDPNIDLISVHLYEYWNKRFNQPWDLAPIMKSIRDQFRGIKPVLLDEYGLGTVDNLTRLLNTVREEGVSGALLWGFRAHRRDGGWYYHNEGGTPINSFHFPGFAVGQPYQETQLLDMVRREAYILRGLPLPPVPAPSPAPILRIQGGNTNFTWRGSTGAAYYEIQRAEKPEGPWMNLATGLHDSILFNVKDFEDSGASDPLVLYTDESIPAGKPHYYRIRGVNVTGATEWSEVLQATR